MDYASRECQPPPCASLARQFPPPPARLVSAKPPPRASFATPPPPCASLNEARGLGQTNGKEIEASERKPNQMNHMIVLSVPIVPNSPKLLSLSECLFFGGGGTNFIMSNNRPTSQAAKHCWLVHKG